VQFYVLLVISTVLIFGLAAWIWLKTRNVSFPLGLALIYYLSLYGAWSIVTDKLGGDSGKHYYYLEEKLFSVALDANYFYSLILYSAFIVALEIVLLWMLRSSNLPLSTKRPPLWISHVTILTISTVAVIFSYLIVRQGIADAQDVGKSAYDLLRRGTGEDTSSLFTIHQILLRTAAISSALGFVVYMCGDGAVLIRGKATGWIGTCYVVVLGMTVWLSFVAGYKSELFVPGVAGSLFYLANAARPRLIRLGVGAIIVLTGMWAVDLLRFVPLSDFMRTLGDMKPADFSGVFQFATSSNESFAAHFSMYGVLAHHVPITYGSSLWSFAASVVPRLIWPTRPEEIYEYYARSVSATPGQGYTIHHATGWYLNFGTVGILLGAMLMGYVWAKCYKGYLNTLRSDNLGWRRVLGVLSPWMFVAEIPTLMRAGPETYKSLLIEAILIPTVVLSLAVRRDYVRTAKSARVRAASKEQLEFGVNVNPQQHVEGEVS